MDIISYKYYEHPYLQTLQTKIVSGKKQDSGYLVVLEETIFYPTGGGQPHDTGFINDVPVLDVFEKEGIVYHLLAKDPGTKDVSSLLNWERRFDHMQQHTGQHLLSALFLDKYAYTTESFHLGTAYSSIDISAANLSIKEQQAVETAVNTVILDNLPVHFYMAKKEELKDIPVRKLPPQVEEIRIVEIEKIDYSPCSGTHVARTGEIGSLKILKAEKYKGMTRVYFLCGERARQDYSVKHALISELIALLSVPLEDLPQRVADELEQKRELEQEIQRLQNKLLSYQAQEIVAQATTSPLFINLSQGTVEQAQQLAGEIFELGTFSLVITVGERLVLTHNLPDFLHCGKLVKQKALPLGGRGGGSKFSAQVYFPLPEQSKEFQDYLKKYFEIPS